MKHGANIYKYAKQITCKEEEIIDFSSNINLYQPMNDIVISTKNVSRYADSTYGNFKKLLAQKYELKKSQIALYNGATASIYALINSLESKNVFLYAPLYGEYEKACSEKNIEKINRFTQLEKEPLEGSIVVFVNPSTPEGKYYKLEKLMSIWKAKKCTVILDESFLEFEDLPSYRGEIDSYKRLYIVQSFSKFYACAGVRIGAIFSNKKNIQKLPSPLWNLSSLDVNFLQKRLKDEGFEQKSRKKHQKQKRELEKILAESTLFEKILPSDANYILTYSKSATKIFDTLLSKKILVRKCKSFDYLSNSWLRFAVKDVKSHKKLKKVLNELS